MATANGQRKDHRSRKNPASREAWIRDKRKNRPKQIYAGAATGWVKVVKQ